MSDVTVTGPRNFKKLPPDVQGPIRKGMAAAARIQLAKEAAERVVAGIKAADDLPFWAHRMRRAIRRGKNEANNQWSLRGSTEQYYMDALGRLLGEPFKVHAGYSHNPPPGGYGNLYVTVYW